MKKLLFVSGLILLCGAIFNANAQSRKAVSAAEVNGTFRMTYTGKFKDNYNEIKILSVGKGSLHLAFQLMYPFIDGAGEMSANTGEADGTATIEGDTAIYSSSEFGQCRITIKFVKRGMIKVTQEGDSECGFGFNVSADGTYQKSSGAKPKFEDSEK